MENILNLGISCVPISWTIFFLKTNQVHVCLFAEGEQGIARRGCAVVDQELRVLRGRRPVI